MAMAVGARGGLLWATLFSLVGLVILIGLGTWQLQRKAQKEALIERIEARRAGEPQSLSPALAVREPGRLDYQRVTATGRFIPDTARFYYAPQPQLGPGYDVYQPLRIAPGVVVWVNRGFIPERVKDDVTVWKAPDGEVTVTGTARLPAEPGTFTPENNVGGNVWYWRDLAGMHQSAFAADSSVSAAPVFLVEEPPERLSDVARAHLGDGPWPRPGVSRLVIFNRHLEYALTWYGLALTLVGVYAAFVYTRLKGLRQAP